VGNQWKFLKIDEWLEKEENLKNENA